MAQETAIENVCVCVASTGVAPGGCEAEEGSVGEDGGESEEVVGGEVGEEVGEVGVCVWVGEGE